MPAPEVSIILPVHNGAETVVQALESCLAQTFRDLEVLAVDDGSNDNTSSLLAAFLDTDPRVQLLCSHERVGVTRAFQLGLEQAKGRFIARMDADDLNEPTRIAKQHELLTNRPDLGGTSCMIRILKRSPEDPLETLPPEEGFARFESWVNRLVEPESIAAERFVDTPLINPTMLVRREILDRHGTYRELSWAEDYDLWLRLLHAGIRFAKVPEVLFTWFDHDNRLTRTDDIYHQDAFLRCKAHYLSLLPIVRDRKVAICGAGPIGKSLASKLQKNKVTVKAFYEVHPRRIGKIIGGVPVLGMDAWLTGSHDVVLAAVGQPGKRDLIRGLALERGHSEGETFFAVA